MDRIRRIVDVAGALKDERDEEDGVGEGRVARGKVGSRTSFPLVRHRVGAFENVISIIARWFYEAVQARNA